jgi:hypothetical protein
VYAQTSLDQVILDVNKYELRPWYVWENKHVLLPRPDEPPVIWEARLADGAKVGADGEDVVQLASSAYVYFTDEYGRPRVYAPTGGTGDYTSDDLLGDGTRRVHAARHQRPDHVHDEQPVHRQPTRCRSAGYGSPSSTPRSTPVQITLAGFVRHPTEGLVPSWRVRAGDSIIVTDRSGRRAPPDRLYVL